MSVIRYAILGGGFFFYFFAITALLHIIKEENFNKMFLRLVDSNDDGILTSKEFKDFQPCQTYDGKRVNREFLQFGRKVDLNDLAQELTPKIITKSVENCIGKVNDLTDANYLQGLKKVALQTELFDCYDIDNNQEVKWSQFYIGNSVKKSYKPTHRAIFQFFDKNHDWKITKKELNKAKVKDLTEYLGGAQKRRRTRAGGKDKH